MRRIVIPLTGAGLLVAVVATPEPKLPVWDANFSLGITSNSAADEGRHHGGWIAPP